MTRAQARVRRPVSVRSGWLAGLRNGIAPAERGDVVWMNPGHSKLATGRAWLPSGCLQADSPRSRNSVTSAAASARGIGISSLARTDIAP